MSTVEDEAALDRRLSARVAWLRLLAGLAALASLVALWVGESARADHDLQLIAPGHARPGVAIAVRALLLANVEAPQGPTLKRAPVEVRLTDDRGRELSRVTLREAANDSMEGLLPIPETARGALVLDATAALPGEAPMRTRRWIEVDPEAEGAPLHGRVAPPLRQFRLGRTRARGGAPPVPLDVRVVGGACAPEIPCELLVWVGEPAAEVRLRESAAVTPDGAARPSEATAGLVSLHLVVHGPEAEAVVEARRGGALVAERAVRLPVALGEVMLRTPRSVAEQGQPIPLRAQLPPGRASMILDLFRDGLWRRTITFPSLGSDTTVEVPAPGEPGLWRLQGRVDRFSDEGAGARLVAVRGPGQDTAALLREVAREAASWAPAHDRALSLMRAPPPYVLADAERWVAFLLAPGEGLRAPLPPAVGGRAVQVAKLQRTRNYLRFGVVAVLLLGGVVVAATTFRRGLRASAQARSLLAQAGAGDADSAHARRRQTAWVLLLTAGVSMAFLAGALLILAKPLWF